MAAATLANARAILASRFGYSAFRSGQSAAVLSVLRGRDTVVILPTGGGKSLCYQVPAVMLPGLTVVVSPLISLMRDQVGALRAKGIAAAFINSALTPNEARNELVRAARGDLKLLYVAPERFESGDFADRLKPRISLLAVDEAHCISHWGHDFRPSYRRLGDVRKKLGSPPTIALTATATPEVRSDIVSQLHLDRPTAIVTGFDRTNLRYCVVEARTDALKTPIIQQAVLESDGTSIVYASTKRSVDRITAFLKSRGVDVAGYHAGLDSERRKTVQDAFMSGKVRTIVATNAFGMGIDKPDVRLVVHHSMPGTLEAYYQEAGRAGRDGQQSSVLLLHSFADRFTHEFFISNAYPQRAMIEAAHDTLQGAAQDNGFIAASVDELVSRSRVKMNSRQMENAIRILGTAGVVERVEPHASRVSVRLLADRERIICELGDHAPMEIGLLRALWSAVGEDLFGGVEIDLNGLPPGLNGPATCIPLLDDLQSRQFIHWIPTGGGLRLESRSRKLEIDWSALEARRRGEVGKLDTMQRYAYAKSCRRAFFLHYFGETPRAGKCSSCDNCTGRGID